MSPFHFLTSDKRLTAVLALWLATVAGGMGALGWHAASPGAASAPPPTWPADSKIARRPGRATLVVFAHPRCPCSRATIAELERIAARSGERIDAHVLFLRPAEVDAAWTRSATWRQAESIRGVHVAEDPSGQESRRFAAQTSGFAVLYDVDGRLTFSGGITQSRGHEGDSDGHAAIADALARPTTAAAETCVYGCPLASSPTAAREQSLAKQPSATGASPR